MHDLVGTNSARRRGRQESRTDQEERCRETDDIAVEDTVPCRDFAEPSGVNDDFR
jgi:hypothetical protein